MPARDFQREVDVTLKLTSAGLVLRDVTRLFVTILQFFASGLDDYFEIKPNKQSV